MTEPADFGVRDAAAALAAGHVSAVDLATSCIGRIESERGRAINAFIHLDRNAALEGAAASDRRRAASKPLSPLDGIPIAVKDNIDIRSMPTTNGLGTSWTAAADAGVVRRLRDAGMILLGKLNMHEGALGATTDNWHHGRCHHPHFPGFTPGGSSGGSAAAVAGGLCPVTLGSDTMGSVRLPAAYCGVVGFKPSRDYWPLDGTMALAFGLDTIGPLARSVADIACLLDAQPQESAAAGKTFARLANDETVENEPACQAAYDTALAKLRAHGIDLASLHIPGYVPGAVRRAGFIVSEVDGATVHERLLAERRDAFSPDFLAMLNYGRRVTPERYQAERRKLEEASATFLPVFERADVIVGLTAPQRSFPFGDTVPANQADLTAIANVSGCPAISLPLPVSEGERPIGLQIMTAPGTDHLLLAIAALIESILMS